MPLGTESQRTECVSFLLLSCLSGLISFFRGRRHWPIRGDVKEVQPRAVVLIVPKGSLRASDKAGEAIFNLNRRVTSECVFVWLGTLVQVGGPESQVCSIIL